MNQPSGPLAGQPATLDLDALQWFRITGGPEFDYHIDYACAVLKSDATAGRVELVIRWEPEAYCHFHRHLGVTTATVLQGEQHLTEERQFETVSKLRTAGFRGPITEGDVHMERGGPEGMTILFEIEAPDGRLFDLLDASGATLMTVTVDDFIQQRLGVPM